MLLLYYNWYLDFFILDSSLYKAGYIFKHDYVICIEYEFLLPNIERFIINGNISFYFKNFFII